MAKIERGIVLESSADGYTIKSLDRDGIVTPKLLPIDNRAYSDGDMVYFFYFPDGTGRIICGV